MTIPGQINIEYAVGKINAAIANESIPGGDKAPALLLRVRTFEIFIEGFGDGIPTRRDIA